MILLFTDFSLQGPYVAQLKAAIYNINPELKIIDLMHDAPVFDIKHSACLLNSLIPSVPANSIFCCVVDPGVGSSRRPIVIKSGNNYFIGPDNGLFEYIYRKNDYLEFYNILWRPQVISNTFHGRDLFAPIAARISNGIFDGIQVLDSSEVKRYAWSDDLCEIIYIDHFGNLMTGIRSSSISNDKVIFLKGNEVIYSDTYSNMPEDTLCWYINSNQLVEIGLNKKNAAVTYYSQIGDLVELN